MAEKKLQEEVNYNYYYDSVYDDEDNGGLLGNDPYLLEQELLGSVSLGKCPSCENELKLNATRAASGGVTCDQCYLPSKNAVCCQRCDYDICRKCRENKKSISDNKKSISQGEVQFDE